MRDVAYVDGTYLEKQIGYGIVILRDGQVVEELSGIVEEPEYQPMRQVGGELQAVLTLLEWCREHGISRVAIYYDYTGIEKWAKGEWKTNNVLTRGYVSALKTFPITIEWHKVAGHSGDLYNTRADTLARNAAIEQHALKHGKRTPARPQQTGDTTPAKNVAPQGLEFLEGFAPKFARYLGERGIQAAFEGIQNHQYARITLGGQGIMDIYSTPKRSPRDPYFHGFADRTLLRKVTAYWVEFLEAAMPNAQAALSKTGG